MTKDVDLDYLQFIHAELQHRRESLGHTHVDLEWLLKRLDRGFTGADAEPIPGWDPEAETKRFSEDRQRVGLVGAGDLSRGRKLRASLGDGPYTVAMTDDAAITNELFRNALSSISLAERETSSSAAEKVRDMARIARTALKAAAKAKQPETAAGQ